MDKLIICIDRDNDIGDKAQEQTPVIGREKNLKTAQKLGIGSSQMR